MSPEFEQLTKRVEALENTLNALVGVDRLRVNKLLQIGNGRNIQLGVSTGTKIGTATTQKLGFYGVTPVVQGGAISSPTGGATIDTQARNAIDSIRAALTSIGITA